MKEEPGIRSGGETDGTEQQENGVAPVREFVAVDLETTGLNPYRERIIEIAAVRHVEGKETDSFRTFVNPGRPIPDTIVELTGIDDGMVTGAPGEEEALSRFLEFAKESVLLGHNLIFDYGFLKCAMARLGREYERKGIDTLELARKYLPELPSRSLGALCLHYRIDSGSAHRALYDARSAAGLYERLAAQFGGAEAAELVFPLKKREPVTAAQKNYLNDLIKYHKIKCNVSFEQMSKSEASRMIDKIILEYGKPQGRPRGRSGAARRKP